MLSTEPINIQSVFVLQENYCIVHSTPIPVQNYIVQCCRRFNIILCVCRPSLIHLFPPFFSSKTHFSHIRPKDNLTVAKSCLVGNSHSSRSLLLYCTRISLTAASRSHTEPVSSPVFEENFGSSLPVRVLAFARATPPCPRRSWTC